MLQYLHIRGQYLKLHKTKALHKLSACLSVTSFLIRCMQCRFLFARLQILFICILNLNSLSIEILNNLTYLDGIIYFWSMYNPRFLSSIPKNISWNFLGLATSWLALNQNKVFFISTSKSEITASILDAQLWIVLSSAKLQTSVLCMK